VIVGPDGLRCPRTPHLMDFGHNVGDQVLRVGAVRIAGVRPTYENENEIFCVANRKSEEAHQSDTGESC
jgi:hypothetical protein